MSDKRLFDEFDTRRRRVKEFAKLRGVPLWKVATVMGLNDGNLSRKLRNLTEKQVTKICGVINELSEQGGDFDEI